MTVAPTPAAGRRPTTRPADPAARPAGSSSSRSGASPWAPLIVALSALGISIVRPAPVATLAPTGQAAERTWNQVSSALQADRFQVQEPQNPFRPGETAELLQVPRKVLQAILPASPNDGYVMVYELPTNTDADRVGRDLAAYVSSGPGAIQYPRDTQFVVQRVGQTARLLLVLAGGEPGPPARPSSRRSCARSGRRSRPERVYAPGMSETFRATIQQTGKTACGIEVPESVVTALGGTKRPAVVVTLDQLLLPEHGRADGRRLVGRLSAEHREASGLRAGDEVQVTLELDTAPRVIEVPPELAAALDADPGAKAFFDGLSYSNKSRLHPERRRDEQPRDEGAPGRAGDHEDARGPRPLISRHPRRRAAARPRRPRSRTRSRLTLNVWVRGKSASGHTRQPAIRWFGPSDALAALTAASIWVRSSSGGALSSDGRRARVARVRVRPGRQDHDLDPPGARLRGRPSRGSRRPAGRSRCPRDRR